MPEKNEGKNINEYIGRRIKEIRIEKELKQENLVKKLDVKRPTISKYETGEIAIPLDTLKKISEILNISIDYLFGITTCKTPKKEYRALCDSTGITDTAIKILEDLNFVYSGQYLIPLLNFLIEQENLQPDESFFEGIYSQIENSKMTDKEKKRYTRKVQNIYDRMYKRWEDKNYIPLLSKIENYITAEAEDENLCLMLSGKIKREKEITNDIEKLHIIKKIPKQKILDEILLDEIIEDLKKLKQKYIKEKK